MKDVIDILKEWDEDHNARAYELKKQAENPNELGFKTGFKLAVEMTE